MKAYYSVVQYVPDVVRDERINIGVVAFSEGRVASQFLKNWQRVRKFGGDDVSLKDSAHELGHMSVPQIAHAIETWAHSIQLTPASPSLLSVEELLIDATRRYLVDVEVTERANRKHTQVAANAVGALKTAVQQRINPPAANFIKRKIPIQGTLDLHELFGAQNGDPVFGATAISFQSNKPELLKRAIDAVSWKLDDIRTADTGIPLSVVAALPRDGNHELFNRASAIYRELGAEVVEESNLAPWADRMAAKVEEHLPPYLFSKQ
jgi:hypothetical protein